MQRDHDALEEACRRLAGAGCLPDRAGQPTQVQLHLTLDQLRDQPGAREAEAAWRAGQAAGDGQPGWLSGPGGAGVCVRRGDHPVVTGHLDPAALDAMTGAFLAPRRSCPLHGPGRPGGRHRPAPSAAPGEQTAPGRADACPVPAAAAPGHRSAAARHPAGLRADVLSGPGGLAAFLRTRLLGGEFPGSACRWTSARPPRPYRAPAPGGDNRDRHCAFPGCTPPRPPATCTTCSPGPTRALPARQPGVAVRLPPLDRCPSMGLGPDIAPRRHRHREQPRTAKHPAQPRATPPHRLTRWISDLLPE